MPIAKMNEISYEEIKKICNAIREAFPDKVDKQEDIIPDDKQFDAPILLKEPEDYHRFYADKPHCELVNKIIELSRTCEWWY